MYRRKPYAKPKASSTFGINITSMTDMFTILLVFLLQTYSTAEFQIEPEQGLTLPSSDSTNNPVQALELTVTNTEVRLGTRVLASLSEQKFASASVDKNDGHFVPSVFSALDELMKSEQAKKEKGEAKLNAGILDGRLILKADASLPYETLRKVMYTASMAGFPKLKVATVLGN
jgi:biopolymer transport protein ExbD